MSSTSARPVSSASEVTTGLALMFLSVMFSPLIDIFAKLAVVTIPSAEVTAGRFFVQALCMLPIVIWRRTFADFSWRQSLFHAIRGLIITVSMISFVTTLKYMAVADAIAIFFVEPIMVTILGGIFLKETIGWRRYTACGVGFFGAMLIIQPSFQEVGYIALLPVLSALCIAIFVLMTRVLSHREDPWAMQFQMGIWGLIFCTILLFIGDGSGSDLFDPVMPEGSAWFYVAGVGAMAAVAGIFGVYAYRAAPASTLAPLQYFEIVSATIFAWLVFGDFPNAVKWLGIAIIMASGLYILWRERRFASKPVSDTSEATLAP
ncbi:DMT family transporter [Rhizobium leguminosarum]|uniref:Drug/metabolite transporter (DMT)-like permease n=1 Tax=Rhizobium leguminosarum TaxID=384 RepID=A0A7X0DUG5_RHILE|nr:DMT family transporter [Rhizobium leguminosarum]MBB6223600.1 drug/metabolite transporter (DMT)-like permease [Rhizobium leguminosarum]